MSLQETKKEQAFYEMMYNEDNEIDELRRLIVNYLECSTGKYGEKNLKELLLYADIKECEICGAYDLEEDMHETEEGYQCSTCWEAR